MKKIPVFAIAMIGALTISTTDLWAHGGGARSGGGGGRGGGAASAARFGGARMGPMARPGQGFAQANPALARTAQFSSAQGIRSTALATGQAGAVAQRTSFNAFDQSNWSNGSDRRDHRRNNRNNNNGSNVVVVTGGGGGYSYPYTPSIPLYDYGFPYGFQPALYPYTLGYANTYYGYPNSNGTSYPYNYGYAPNATCAPTVPVK